MTIIYNRNTPEYYLVSDLDQDAISGRTYGHKTRNLSGDFIVISSDHKVNDPLALGYKKTWEVLKKALLVLILISMIPFSTVPAAGYVRLIINGEVG